MYCTYIYIYVFIQMHIHIFSYAKIQDPACGVTVCKVKNRYARDAQVLDGYRDLSGVCIWWRFESVGLII